ncbi:MAG: hypothetical protein U0V56_08405 [Actinomycetota bacterium]
MEQPEVPTTARWAIGISFALAVGVGVLRAANTEAALRSAEAVGNVAFALVFALPGLLGLIGLRRRPALLIAAGLLDLALAFVTLMSLVGVAFIVPAVLFLIADRVPPGPLRTAAAVIVCVALGSAAFLALFVREDPACWARTSEGVYVVPDPGSYVRGSSISTPGGPGITESGCTSDTISPLEALLAAALVGLTLGAGWGIAKPREPGPETPENAGGGAYASAP